MSLIDDNHAVDCHAKHNKEKFPSNKFSRPSERTRCRSSCPVTYDIDFEERESDEQELVAGSDDVGGWDRLYSAE